MLPPSAQILALFGGSLDGITTASSSNAVRHAIMGGIYYGLCNDLVRASVGLAFHDAGTLNEFNLGIFNQPTNHRFYSGTQSASATPGTFRLNSDDDWGRDYSAAHKKMSLLGIDKNTLTDCTEFLPLSAQDPTIDPAKLEAAIQQYRSIWL
ncbi:hypothetical protein B0H17DRAFT_1218143 [Mycena rosella]|uniref:Uncharacterized protein n=1 Tax=Mycena rosella TaxID=1033263 RepID=A0AAD7BSV8_MYCRO|nr:hypothetical protein B0H17DRAFT_1218143 [Mycena rosella]